MVRNCDGFCLIEIHIYILGNDNLEHVCGRPLGIRRFSDNELIIVQAYHGLFKLNVKTSMSGNYLRYYKYSHKMNLSLRIISKFFLKNFSLSRLFESSVKNMSLYKNALIRRDADQFETFNFL